MSKLKDLPPIVPTTCPVWCAVATHDEDFDAVAGIRFQLHTSRPARVTCYSPDAPNNPDRDTNFVVGIERMDNHPTDPGYVAVRLRDSHSEHELSLADAASLAYALLEAVLLATAKGAR